MIQDIKAFCKLFYEATFLSINCYDYALDKSYTYPEDAGFNIIVNNPSPDFLNFKRNPDYFVSDSFTYYGYVESSRRDYCLIVGPIFSTPVTESDTHNFMKEWAIDASFHSRVSQFLQSIPQQSLYSFLNVLAYLHFCINDEVISVSEHFQLEGFGQTDKISSIYTEKIMELKENQRYHNTHFYEKEMMKYVQDGDVRQLKELLNNSQNLVEGIVAGNALRQRKNIFITTATLTTRAAIQGGMNLEEAYQLADIYIQDCEHSQNIAYIEKLSYSMLIDFTERVAKGKIPGGMSKEIFDCVQFISRHVKEAIQVGDVTEHIGKSRSYLTKKFKKELGFDISSFIMRCKLEESKSLLTFTEKSLSEISSYLCFSSQAYFQNVFKKKYGITPTQYRKQTQLTVPPS